MLLIDSLTGIPQPLSQNNLQKKICLEPRQQNELNDKGKLQALVEIISEVYFQITKQHIIITVVVKK
jgi:hypothetical protein